VINLIFFLLDNEIATKSGVVVVVRQLRLPL
jgi:hypothetical protein